MIKPLDIVQTPKGGIAMVTECSPATENLNVHRYSVDYIINLEHEHNAWWQENQLVKLTSIPVLVSKAMCHPFGGNSHFVNDIFDNVIQ